MQYIKQHTQGFSPIEVLLASTLFGVIVTAMIGTLIYSQLANINSGDRTRAVMIADEGIQAARSIRNPNYTNLVDGTFGLAQVSGKWTLSGTSDTSGIYTRQTTIATSTANSKLITSTVSWTQNGSAKSVSVKSILSNWAAGVKTWINTILTGSYDATGTTNAYKVATQGNFAYLIRNSTTGPNFIILNISNPAAPALVGSLTLANIPTGIAVSGNYAYISNSGSATEMQTVNIQCSWKCRWFIHICYRHDGLFGSCRKRR
jgi:Tfp pilus assembly protein PilV